MSLYALAAMVLLGPVVWGVTIFIRRRGVQKGVINELENEQSERSIAAITRALGRRRRRKPKRVLQSKSGSRV